MSKTALPQTTSLPVTTSQTIQSRIATALPNLTSAQIKMAAFIQANLFRSATMRIEEFARANNVSNATANRFARSLGFDGYPAFRACLMQEYENAQSPVERLRTAQRASHKMSNHAIIQSALEADMANLEATRQLLTSEACEQAIQSLLHAQRIYILGMGTSAHLANQLEYGLSPYCKHVQSLAQVSGSVNAARQLHDVSAKDLVVALVFPRYVRDTVQLAYAAHQKQARILGLTDAPTSPLASFADITLYLKTERQFAANSDAIVLSMIQALCGAVAYHRPHAADDAASMTAATRPWLLSGDDTQAFPPHWTHRT